MAALLQTQFISFLARDSI